MRSALDALTRPASLIGGGLVAGGLLAVGAPAAAVVAGAAAALAIVAGLTSAGSDRRERVPAVRLRPPWDAHLEEAVSSHRRYVDAVALVSDPSLRADLEATGRRLEDGIDATRTIAGRGQQLDDALAALPDPDDLSRRMRELRRQGVGHDDQRWTSLARQRETAERVMAQRAEVLAKLDTIDAQLDAAVAHAIETGLAADAGRVRDLTSTVDASVAELEALNDALGEIGG